MAELLDTSVVSVNSALQRARSTLAESNVAESDVLMPQDEEQRALLARYVDAFERFDIDSLVVAAPRGRHHVDAALRAVARRRRRAPQVAARRRFRLSRLAVRARRGERVAAFAQWRAGGPGGSFEAWAIHVLRVSDGRISGIDFFVDPDLFPLFGLPVRLGEQAAAHR